jgi:hypothetical protein
MIMGKVYRGKRLKPEQKTGSEVAVTVNGKPLRHVVRHSPTGMSWGYGGSGPADTALTILVDVFGGRIDLVNIYYQQFKFHFVAEWGDKWELTSEEIEAWLLANTGVGIEELTRKFDSLSAEQRKEIEASGGVAYEVLEKH